MLSKITDRMNITLIEFLVWLAIVFTLIFLLLPVFVDISSGPSTYVVSQNGKIYEGYSVHNNYINKYDSSIILETHDGQIVLDPKNGAVNIKRIKVK